jgi:hypothetical protein
LQQAYQHSEEVRRQTLQESERLQREAHRYVDQVLQDLELRLVESLRVIRNGRQICRPNREESDWGLSTAFNLCQEHFYPALCKSFGAVG